MATPVGRKLSQFYAAVTASGGCNMMGIGDSISAEGNNTGTFGTGVQRTWKVEKYVGSGHRAAATGPTGSSVPYQDTPFSAVGHSLSTGAGSLNARLPGATFTDGSSGFNPQAADDIVLTNDAATAGATMWRGDIGWSAGNNDLNNFASQNPYNQALKGRVILHTKPTGQVPQLRLNARRNSAATGGGTLISPGTSEGIAGYDIDIPSASTHPGLALLYESGVNETNTSTHVLGFKVFCVDGGGAKQAGFEHFYIATGAYTTEDMLAVIGGGGAPTVTAQNFLAYCLAHDYPTCAVINAGQNATAAESADYAGGGYSVYKANMLALIQALRARFVSMHGVTKPILVISGYEGGTDAYNALRSIALDELAQSEPEVSFVNSYELMPKSPGSGTNPWWQYTDFVHPWVTGTSLMAMGIWAAMRAATDHEVFEPRSRGSMRLGL